jgi:hypothetical protein
VANLFCSAWDDDGQQWWLVLVRRFGPSLASMSTVSGAPPAKMKAPKWALVFSEAPRVVNLALGSGERRGDGKGRCLGFELWVNKIRPDRFLFIGVPLLMLVIGANSSSTRFSIRIRGHFR